MDEVCCRQGGGIDLDVDVCYECGAGARCDECGKGFSVDEWAERHDPDSRVFHEDCCPDCADDIPLGLDATPQLSESNIPW